MAEYINKWAVVDKLTALENEFQQFKPFEGFEHAMYRKLCEVEMEIGKMPAAETAQRWIPVTERLPEEDLPKDSKTKQLKVVVAYKTNGRWVVRTQIRVKRYWYGNPDKWEWIKTSDPITHWMPLPEPPGKQIKPKYKEETEWKSFI